MIDRNLRNVEGTNCGSLKMGRKERFVEGKDKKIVDETKSKVSFDVWKDRTSCERKGFE